MTTIHTNQRADIATDAAPPGRWPALRHPRIAAIAGAAVMAALALVPATASAGTVSTGGPSSPTLAWIASKGESNNVAIAQAGSEIVVRDERAPITTNDPRCRVVSEREVRCSARGGLFGGVLRLRMNGLDGDDQLYNLTNLPSQIYGGRGKDIVAGGLAADELYGEEDHDQLFGQDGNDIIRGGSGHDQLRGGLGNDHLQGQEGDDLLFADPGADNLFGGPGEDEVLYRGYVAPVHVDLEGDPDDGASKERDRVLPDVENITGGNGNDTLVGNAVANVISGEKGDDRISGNGGDDRLWGMDGNDVIIGHGGADLMVGLAGRDIIRAADGTRDTVDCGAGPDQVTADRIDTVSACEQVRR
jgi:Ca2+-binding RTX toxin-like protein